MPERVPLTPAERERRRQRLAAVFGDVHDAGTLADAVRGCSVAYYLVHSLDSADFEDKDAQAARNFATAASAAGVPGRGEYWNV